MRLARGRPAQPQWHRPQARCLCPRQRPPQWLRLRSPRSSPQRRPPPQQRPLPSLQRLPRQFLSGDSHDSSDHCRHYSDSRRGNREHSRGGHYRDRRNARHPRGGRGIRVRAAMSGASPTCDLPTETHSRASAPRHRDDRAAAAVADPARPRAASRCARRTRGGRGYWRAHASRSTPRAPRCRRRCLPDVRRAGTPRRGGICDAVLCAPTSPGSASHPEAREHALAPFVGQGMDAGAGLQPPASGEQRVQWAQVVQERTRAR